MGSGDIYIEKALLAAEGYSQLGMPDEALAELDQLPQEGSIGLEVAKVRLPILIRASHWEAAIETARFLCKMDDQDSEHWVHHAFCLHETGQTKEAREVLRNGPSALMKKAIYFYNLACYEAVLGDLEEAQAHLRTAFEMDGKFREYARTDPDLEEVRDLL